jgi:hypothetical protein
MRNDKTVHPYTTLDYSKPKTYMFLLHEAASRSRNITKNLLKRKSYVNLFFIFVKREA